MVVILFAQSSFIDAGDEARTWVAASLIVMLGLVAAVGWTNVRSAWRLLGVVVLAGAAIVFVLLAPRDAWNRPMGLKTYQ